MDFLFLCEIPAREQQAYALLCAELRRRGYSAEYLFSHEWEFCRNLKKVKVLALNGCTTPFSLCRSVYTTVGKVKKVVTFRWEQILPNCFAKCGSEFRDHMCRTARTTNFLCWGEATRERLLQCGVNQNNVFVSGMISMDFLHKKFKNFYRSREEICFQYGIDTTKKILLYNSSFANATGDVDLHDSGVEYWGEARQKEAEEFESKSQKIILDWFESLLSERDDIIVIYRPHPVERCNSRLQDIERSYENFHVISQYSVQQWIKIADYISTTFSTSIAEAYFAGKECLCLRPIEMLHEIDMAIYDTIPKISTYEMLKRSLSQRPALKKDAAIERQYANNGELAYLKICDILEQVLRDPSHNIQWAQEDLQYCRRNCWKWHVKGTTYRIRRGVHRAVKAVLRCAMPVLIPQKLLKTKIFWRNLSEKIYAETDWQRREKLIAQMSEMISEDKTCRS